MSALWNAVVRRIKTALYFVCPFCTTDYGPTSTPPEPSNEVYEPKKERTKKHIRKTDAVKADEIIRFDEEAGFSSKSVSSNSQCPDVEVENSDEINRVLVRKSQFLPPEPYQPPEEEVFTIKRLQKPETLERQVSLVPQWTQKPTAKTPTPDSASQYSKKSKKSIFGLGKKKKAKKDADSVSIFSFASFKSGKSASSRSELLEKKLRNKRKKEEKKDKKAVEKQQLNLSHGLGDQKLQNIYPWMNDIEPFDDEVPNVIEEIRIREAQALYNPLPSDDKSYAAESLLDLGTQMIAHSQIVAPVAPSPLQNRFGVPDEIQRKPFAPAARNTPPARPRQLSSDPETAGVIRKARKSLAEIEPSISIDDTISQPRVKSPENLHPLLFKKKDIFANVLPPRPVERKAPNPKPPSPKPLSPKPPSPKSPSPKAISPKPPNPKPPSPKLPSPKPVVVKKSESVTDDDRDIKQEIQDITERDDFFQVLSENSERRSRRKSRSPAEKEKRRRHRERRKSERDDRSETRKKTRSPAKIESNPIEDRSIDDLPIIVEKDIAADLTNPLLFPEPPQHKKKVIPIVNYTKNIEVKPNEDTDKVESIKEIRNTLDRRMGNEQQPENKNEPKKSVEKVDNNREEGNSTVRVVVDAGLVAQRMDYFNLDSAAVDHFNYRGVESERDLVIKDGRKSGNYIPGQGAVSEGAQNKRRRRRRGDSTGDVSERRHRRRRVESDAERSERHRKRRDSSERSDRRRRDDSEADRSLRRRSRREKSEGTEPRDRRRRRSRSAVSENEARPHRRSRPSSPEEPLPQFKQYDIVDFAQQSGSRRRRRRSGDSNIAHSEADIPARHRSRERRDSRGERDPARRRSTSRDNVRQPRDDNVPDKEAQKPEELYEKGGSLKPFPSHITRDIKNDIIEKRRKEFQEKKQLELIRQKMDLDFQSVDTKRSIFMINNDPLGSPSRPSQTFSNRAKSNKKDKRSKGPAPKERRRVSSRPLLAPLRSQEEIKLAPRPPRVIHEVDEDKSGSTIHSGDEKPVVIKRQSSFTSNDSTLKDIDDIPSLWNVSVRSRQLSVDSVDSRITHRSQLSGVNIRGNRNSPKVPADKGKKKKR